MSGASDQRLNAGTESVSAMTDRALSVRAAIVSLKLRQHPDIHCHGNPPLASSIAWRTLPPTYVSGGGINVALRVMDCGGAGHILLLQRGC